MNKFDPYLQLLIESITRASEKEISYYMEEVFGNSATNLEFIEVNPNNSISSNNGKNHTKFDTIRFNFIYNKNKLVKVFSSPGVNSSKRENGSLTVTAFVYDYNLTTEKHSKSYINKISNAFYNPEIKDVDYNPTLQTGEDVLKFIKRGLSDDGGGEDETPKPQPIPPNSKKIKKQQYAYA